MAIYSGNQFNLNMQAGEDLSSYQYRVMEADTSGGAPQVQLTTAASSLTLVGILQDDSDTVGEPASVCVMGETKVAACAATAITYGCHLKVNGTGYAVVGSSGTTNTWGRALEALASGTGIIRAFVAFTGWNDPS